MSVPETQILIGFLIGANLAFILGMMLLGGRRK